MRPITTPDIWTPERLAARWSVTAEVVTDMCRRGDLRAFKAGRQWRITTAAITRYEHGEAAA